MTRPVILVHGGAWFIAEDEREAHIHGCRRAALAGWDCLCSGGTALDTVEVAVRVLEDDPAFDAGRGSNINRVGDIEMDAIIMDGKTLNLGAVAAVQHIRNPISLARLVMEQSDYSFLVAHGAQAFAREHGIPMCADVDLMGRRDDGGWRPPVHGPSDTVGAVALDIEGNIAVATSTGGTPNKYQGRVGDSPLVGSGAYADNCVGAASATGSGEMLMRIVASKTACDFLASGQSAQQAAVRVVQLLADRIHGYGGLIVIDRYGRIGVAHNTPNMAYAYVVPDQDVVAGAEVEAENSCG